MPFDIIPAIDLLQGRVVRLRRGDFTTETGYGEDPASAARLFAHAGVHRMHVVDLDGARAGRPVNVAAIEAIIQAVGAAVEAEIAGGLRTPDAVADALELGAARVVVGTAVLRDPAFAAGLVAAYGPDRIISAIDVRDGRAVGDAWQEGADGPAAADAIGMLADAGIATFEVTAIDRDGLLEGPDLALLGRLVALDRGGVIASGGIASLSDIRAVAELGCDGAIVGRALYEGRIDLGEAVAVALSFD
jgi:phosphoribosylformimino-5-aminoimidazole carboxamide ribotide isomerase